VLRAVPISALILIVAIAPASADPGRGLLLAERWCVGCHVIGPDSPGGDAGPAFPAVAQRPDTSFDSLRVWLADPHPPMPDLDLSAAEFDDLADYILSLKP